MSSGSAISIITLLLLVSILVSMYYSYIALHKNIFNFYLPVAIVHIGALFISFLTYTSISNEKDFFCQIPEKQIKKKWSLNGNGPSYKAYWGNIYLGEFTKGISVTLKCAEGNIPNFNAIVPSNIFITQKNS